MVFGAMADIALISMGLTIVSQFLQNRFAHRDEMKAHQEKMKKHQEKMKELMKKDDHQSRSEREKIEAELMEEMNKMMSKSMKVMMFSLLVFLPAYWVLGNFFEKEIIALPVPLPWLANGFDLLNPGTWGIQLYSQTNWFGWYFVTYLVITVVIGQIMNAFKIGQKKGVVASG